MEISYQRQLKAVDFYSKNQKKESQKKQNSKKKNINKFFKLKY